MKNFNEKTVTIDAKQTSKQAYEKPAMEVYEMEIEGVIMDSASGASDGGYYGRRSQATTNDAANAWGNLWNEENA